MSEGVTRVGTFRPATRNRGPLIGVAAIMSFTAGSVAFMLAPLLPVLQREFEVSVGEVSWVFTLFLLGSGVSVVLLPRLSDALGDRTAATLGAGAMATGALIPGLVEAYPALLIGALILGLGAATSQIGVGTLRRHLQGSPIQTAVTVTQVAHALGAGAGLVAGGLALPYITMQAFFLSVSALFLVVAVLAYLVIPATPRDPAAQFGMANLIGLVLWLVPLLYGVKKAAANGIQLVPLAFVGLGILGAAVWVQFERRASSPVLKLSLLRSSLVVKTVIAGFTMGLAIQAVTFLIPFYVQTPELVGYGFGYDALDTGLILLPYSLVGAVFGTISGYFVARGRALTVIGIGALCHAAASLYLMFNLAHASSFLVAAIIYGVGSGLVGVGLFGAMQSAVPQELAGMGVSMVGIIMMISGALGSAIYSGVLQSKSVANMPGVPTSDRFVLCMVIALVCDILVATLCLWTRRRAATAVVPIENLATS